MLDWVVVGLDVEWGLGPALSAVSCGRKGLCLAHIVPSNFVYSRCSINAACLHEYKIEQSDYPDVFSLLIFSKSKSSFSPISFPNMLVMVNMDLYSLNTPIPHNSSHREILQVFYKWSPVSQVWVVVKKPVCQCRRCISGSGISPGEGNGNPLQYSCLENPTDRGA